jgi:hypothetical protein
MVATNLPGLGTNTSQVAVAAVGGSTYHFAVDGFNGSTGSVVLNLSLSASGISLSQPVRAGDGFFHFAIISPPGLVLRVDATTNLVAWTAIATVTNVTGSMDFADTNSPNFSLRYYRVVLPGLVVPPLMLTNSGRLVDGQFRFNVIGPTGQVIRLQAATDMATSNWTTIITITNTSGTSVFTDSAATNFTRRFYRAVSP